MKYLLTIAICLLGCAGEVPEDDIWQDQPSHIWQGIDTTRIINDPMYRHKVQEKVCWDWIKQTYPGIDTTKLLELSPNFWLPKVDSIKIKE